MLSRVRSPLHGVAALAVLATLSAVDAPRISAGEIGAESVSDAPVAAAMHDIAEFGKTNASSDLRRALRELASTSLPRARSIRRERATKAWFAFFRVLDGTKDPSFDPRDVPEVSVVPPPSSGIVFFSGVDPAAITDPAARARYERALRANRIKAERYRVQYGLRDLESKALDQFALFRDGAFAPSDKDRADFARLVSAANVTPARKASLGMP